jgi:hypothetical protein
MTLLAPANAVIAYDDADFKSLFPEFGNCTSQQGQSWFLQASTMCDNSASNPLIRQGGGTNWMLQQALYYLTAHLGYLSAPRDQDGNPTGQQGAMAAPQVVGRISSASQGSVSVQTDMQATGGTFSQAYYMQTKYGAAYWEMTKALRTFQYYATPTIVPGPRPGFGRRFWS